MFVWRCLAIVDLAWVGMGDGGGDLIVITALQILMFPRIDQG